MTHLTEHLRLADDHRVERRGDAKKVSHCFFVRVVIEMCLKKTGGQVSGRIEKLCDPVCAELELVARRRAEKGPVIAFFLAFAGRW